VPRRRHKRRAWPCAAPCRPSLALRPWPALRRAARARARVPPRVAALPVASYMTPATCAPCPAVPLGRPPTSAPEPASATAQTRVRAPLSPPTASVRAHVRHCRPHPPPSGHTKLPRRSPLARDVPSPWRPPRHPCAAPRRPQAAGAPFMAPHDARRAPPPPHLGLHRPKRL
jgi:hypothetical protein